MYFEAEMDKHHILFNDFDKLFIRKIDMISIEMDTLLKRT